MTSKFYFQNVTRDAIFQEGFSKLFLHLQKPLEKNKRIVLFLSGGSVMQGYMLLTKWLLNLLPAQRKNLSLAIVDERYNKNTKYAYSNAYQAEKLSKIFSTAQRLGVNAHLILSGLPFGQEANRYDEVLKNLIIKSDFLAAVMGIGADGHIAGILPMSKITYKRFNKKNCYAAALKYPRHEFFERITITPWLIKQFHFILVIALGEKKHTAIERIAKNSHAPLYTRPSLILRHVKNVLFLSDIKIKF